ncbi:HMG-Y-related protein A-like [Hibiscus syriacus]|uniref:HMG-Y-related protein A-like n=1 Tax=Hibiscus syriacus TaxID=106335 RepID=UPI001923003C|nr:HMG-Y-related protein A-like [Hibiscus syriacus]
MDPSLCSISPATTPPPIVPVVAPTTQTKTIAGGLPPSFSHPPYSDMICEAIGALKESNGSSKKAIASDVSTGPKRGRGRPPKPKAADSNPLQQPVPFSDVPKRLPGRPRKSAPMAQLGVIRSQGRGRPGRPKKRKTVRSVVGASAMKRGRGRPPKASIQLPQQAVIPNYGQPVAVPYADSAAVTADIGVPRPRGRPKGTARAAAVVSLGKRRGRPPKIAGVTVKPMKTTGKSVGRPKKATDGAKSESKALAAAHEDFKKKLEFFQLKVRQAVEALKPQFTSESNGSAVDAILELEGLVAINIASTPWKAADAQPPPQAAGQPPVAHDEGQVI